jgi:hypothetical protein
MRPRRFLITVILACAALAAGTMLPTGAVASEAALPDKIEFNRDVRPILSDNCYYCHGPDASHRKAKLRLDIREEALAKEAFIPGNAKESELVNRLFEKDPEALMPPADSHKKLSDRDKAVLMKWIDQGATYQRHWSYEPIAKPEVSQGANPIDFLVRKRLETVGLKPSPEADKRTLIRRLASDLVGIPPTPEEVRAFEQDTDPKAYEKLVDRMLGNPHYGERMAAGWLDVVRFADTIGYHSDNPRNVWPYRDWVIRSFNQNKRFDRFTLEQIAGDLLPDASQETRVGSAFNRLLLSTEEGGAQAKDYEARMLTDRVRAVGAAWLGQTTGCAQCHDHKFDPFTTRDFHTLGAFFADIEEPVIGKREDGMLLLNPEEEKELARLDAALAEARKKVNGVLPLLDIAQKQWEADVIGYDVTLPELREGSAANPGEIKSARAVIVALRKEESKRTARDKEIIKDYFRDRATQLFKTERETLTQAEQVRKQFYDAAPKCLVSKSTPNKRVVRILPRGNWMDETGEIVQPALPHYLPRPETGDRPLTRLDLAQWLVSRDNPLTARTVMNRLWKQFFGTGLSKVLDDLGAQGELPPNGPLLDWLAAEFMDSGWDMKRMVRTIVLSETYRQTSVATPALLAADPYNREHARQSAFRVDAELVRDTALAVSGLLETKIGGPSVKPYQPDGYWDNLNFPTRTYKADTGESQYRRGLYVWWQRSYLHPSLLAFDAPSREECAAERNRSNIPQQALVLLNDPTYVEAARTLAARVLKEVPTGTVNDRLAWAWQRVLQRAPRDEEKGAMNALIEHHRQVYGADPAAASALLKTGFAPVPKELDPVELATWTHVGRVLLNLHETITRS